MLDESIVEAFGALARYVVVDDADAMLPQFVRPLLQTLAQQNERQQRTAGINILYKTCSLCLLNFMYIALCLATLFSSFNSKVIRKNAARLAQRLIGLFHLSLSFCVSQ